MPELPSPATNRPLIGITPSHEKDQLRLSARYLDAIWQAGGLGVLLPYTEDATRLAAYAVLFDGFLFSGGGDPDPALYGQKVDDGLAAHLDIDPARDAFEAALFQAVYHAPAAKPILGICRGMQAINVFLGGTLYPHIEGHRQSEPREARPQTVHLTKGGFLHRLCGQNSLQVNSFHHQAVRGPAPGLVVDAVCTDGIIEAFYAPAHPFLVGVQFHPECYFHTEDTTPHAKKLFAAWMNACRRGRTACTNL